MIKFKDLSNFLKESEFSPWGAMAQSVASPEMGVSRIEDSEQLNAINAVLENYSNKSFINPRAGMAQLKTKLNLAGLDFDFDMKEPIQEGTKEYPMTRYGGEFGTTPTHDLSKGFYESDGISPYNDGVGFVLKCTYSINEDGLYSIKTKVVPNKKSDKKDDDMKD